MDHTISIVDQIYVGICKDNDERPSPALLSALKDRLIADRLSNDSGVVLLRQCRIGLHASLALAKPISDSSLRVLDLAENAIDDCAVVALLQIVGSNPGLQELYLSSNRIGADGARELGRALTQLRQLAVLDLSNDGGSSAGGPRYRNVINGDGLRWFCDQLARSFNLMSLRLAENQIGDRDASVLAQVLRVNLVLTHLDLNRNRIGVRGAQVLFDALTRNRALRHLHLVGNGIGAEAARSIASMLASNTTLVSLDLAGNALGPAIPDLADSLMYNTSLLVLNLAGNGIDNEGAQALAAVLEQNPHLIQMHLGANRIDESGGVAVARALSHNRVLTVLDLSANDIRDAAAIHLAEALVNNTSLIVLDLTSCKIADDGAVAIATAIGSNKDIGLRVLRLRDNFVSNSAGQVVVDELQGNNLITTADFRGNRMEHAKIARIRQICRRNLNHIRNQVPKKLKEHIDELKNEIVRLEDTFARLTDEKAEVNQAMEQLSVINDEKMHWLLAQLATRDELHKRLAGEKQQLAEIQAKVAQKRAEIAANQSNFEKQLKTKSGQYEAEKAQRLRMEEQMAAAREQLKTLQVAFDKTPDEIREEIEQVRREKLKHQGLMTAVRAKYQVIQKGYEGGEGVGEYLERARHSLLQPDFNQDSGSQNDN